MNRAVLNRGLSQVRTELSVTEARQEPGLVLTAMKVMIRNIDVSARELTEAKEPSPLRKVRKKRRGER